MSSENDTEKKMLYCICGKKYSTPPSLCVHRRNCEIHLEHKNKNILKKNQNNLRMVELENEVKLNQIQAKKLQAEYQYQLKIKDLELQVKLQILELKLQKGISEFQPLPPIPVIQQPIPVVEVKPKLTTKEYLQNNCKNALTFTECSTMINDAEYNKFITEINVEDIPKNIISKNYFLDSFWSPNISKNVLDIIEYFFTKIEKNQLPFFCSDKNRNILYIKTEDKWLKNNEENINEFDNILLKFIHTAVYSVYKSIIITNNLFEKRQPQFRSIYEKNFADWKDRNLNELLLKFTLLSDDLEERALSLKKFKIFMSKTSKTFHSQEGEDEDSM